MPEKKEISMLKEENRHLQRAVAELGILNEIATAINSTLELGRILDLIVQRCVHHLHAEQGAILLLEEQRPEKPFTTICRISDASHQRLPYRLDDQLTGWMLKNGIPLLSNDFPNDNRFSGNPSDLFPVKSLLFVPLVSKGTMIGILGVFNKKGLSGFSIDDQRLLSIISTQSSQVIENARLAEKEKALMRVQEELRLAYEIQNNLLPKDQPCLSGYDIDGKSLPAKEVGGDYFDFISPEPGRLTFCLGDVSGKGLPAALLMANLQAAVRGQTMSGSSITECMERVNALLFHNTSPEKFATLFFGCLDSEAHILHYCNAGHNYPFLFRNGAAPQRLSHGSLALGCFEAIPFSKHQVTLSNGDLLLVYSDGISEAINDQDQEYGETRLAEMANANRDAPAAELIEKIMESVRRHAGNSPQLDDMTLLVIKRIS